MAKPIIIVGANRSGTKWISNLISNHSEVSSIQRAEEGGILETNFFLNYPRYFDLKERSSKTAFEIIYHKTSLHKISNISLDSIEAKYTNNFFSIFRYILDEYSKNNNTDYWLQKTGSYSLFDIFDKFPDSKIVIMQRKNIFENVISNILLDSDKIKIKLIIKYSYIYIYGKKIEDKHKKKNQTIFVTFEGLKEDPIHVLKKICSHVGIRYEKGMDVSKFKANTSFKHYNKKEYYTTRNKIIIKATSTLIKIIPYKILRVVYKVYQMINHNGKIKFMPSTFEMYNKN